MNPDELQALLLSPDLTKTITVLTAVRTPPDIAKISTEYEVQKHDILDKAKRPNKVVTVEGENQKPEKQEVVVNRLGIGFQKLIVDRTVAFLFAKAAIISAAPKGANQKTVFTALKEILNTAKTDTINMVAALEVSRSKEVAEYWYPVEEAETHDDYGFPTKFRLKCALFKPWDNNQLYPIFDASGDMIAFVRQFPLMVNGKERKHVDCYTAEFTYHYKQTDEGWAGEPPVPNPIGKIPIVYGQQDQTEWEDVQSLIARLETLLSNFAEINDYHASPTIFVRGGIEGWPKKSEAGKIIRGSKDAEANYLSWNQAPEMVKLEVENLFKLIFMLTQTPDISFEAVKGIGAISGVALELLFTDAHLKAGKKAALIFNDYLERRANIIKAYVGTFKTELKSDARKLKVKQTIQPYTINDLQTLVTTLSDANGGKALLSQKTAVALSGLVEDAEAEYAQIEKEEAARNLTSVTDAAI